MHIGRRAQSARVATKLRRLAERRNMSRFVQQHLMIVVMTLFRPCSRRAEHP